MTARLAQLELRCTPCIPKPCSAAKRDSPPGAACRRRAALVCRLARGAAAVGPLHPEQDVLQPRLARAGARARQPPRAART
eukprot:5893246-Pleurochrysis_carterae.AAC.2